MATGLDVWIAKQGHACKVDDGSWRVTIYDAHDKVFEWGGISYSNLPAPHAHWAGNIPPGTYVVRAVSEDKKLSTDSAIVTVECVKIACAILYVAPSKGRPITPGVPQPEGRCRVEIKEVVGIGESVPRTIKVTGIAANCKKVKVTISCGDDKTSKAEVAVGSNGEWTTHLQAREIGCRCGKPVIVIARCVEHPDCVDKFESDKLRCRKQEENDKLN